MSAPTMDVYYNQGPGEYAKQLAQYNSEQGKTGADLNFIHDRYGLLNYGNIKTPGTLEYRLYNPDAQASQASALVQAKTQFKQATGQDLIGTGLDTVSQHILAGNAPDQALKNLGDLKAYTRFSSDYGANQNAHEVNTPTINNNRSLISQTPQPGYVKGYDTNNNFAPVYVPAGKYVPGVSLYPKASDKITVDASFNQEKPIELGGTVSGTGGIVTGGAGSAGSMIAGANSTLSQIITQLTPPETPEAKSQQTLLDQMASLTGQDANKAADQLTAEQSAQLPQLKTQFADINSKILSKTAEYNALQTENQNKPITMNSIIGNERAILNAKASDIGLLQAQAQGLQGQISVAQETVNRAIDLKYSTIENQLQVKQAQLNALAPILNKQEKIQAEAQRVLIENQKQAIADAKSNEIQIKNVMLEAIKGGIKDTDILSQIAGAKTLNEALTIYAKNTPASAGEHSPIYKEWQDYKNTGGSLSFNDYQTMDANRKRTSTTIINPGEKESDRFAKSIIGAQDQLRSGTSWGAVFNTLFTQYKTGNPEQDAALQKLLDLQLDKNTWSQSGAYQNFKNPS